MSVTALPEQTTVLVIGGGPVGLTASGLLSRHGIANVVVERRSETQQAPAAHVLRQRPLEILSLLGVGDAIRAAASDFPLHYITWCATLGGTEVGRLDIRSDSAGAGRWTNCSQNLLEPILLEHASSQSHAAIARGVECVDLSQQAVSATATLRDADSDTRRVQASWVLVADGAGSRTREQLGIEMLGPGALGRFLMIHFAADLRPWLDARPGPVHWILNPESPGTLIVHDPVHSHVFMMPARGTPDEADTIPSRLAAALGVGVEPRILSHASWSPHVQIAARYRERRAFLIGDAAHRFPPTGGLGLNTGILDAYDLVERIARVEVGGADDRLLDGYETNCRPVAEANAHDSFENLKRLGAVSRAIGPCPGLDALEARLASLSERERVVLARSIEAQRSHFTSEGQLPAAP